MTARMRIDGLRELDAQIERLKPATGKAALRRAATKALQPMAEIARRLAPDDPATPPMDLHTGIVVSSKMKAGRSLSRAPEGKSSVNVYMGPSVKTPRYVHAMVMEFGSFKAAPRPYMRPAWEQDKDALLDRLRADLAAEIDRAVARAARRGTLRG